MICKIALVGNPNSGKTTVFNELTGSSQYVGNWPGVTVEKKEGKLKKRKEITIVDLPGVYSLSPYSLEEVITRDFFIHSRADVILNIVDASNLERNLYLTTQLLEMGLPIVIALNMMDIARNRGDKIDTEKLSQQLKCPVIETSASKGIGLDEAIEKAIASAKEKEISLHPCRFDPKIEKVLQEIENKLGEKEKQNRRWYSIKIFERDKKIQEKLTFSEKDRMEIEKTISHCEKEYEDDSEAIIVNARYQFVSKIIENVYQRKTKNGTCVSDKIDRVVTNRWLALPIFALILFIVYSVSVTTVGTWATDWANDGVFGGGWHLFGIGTAAYEEALEDFNKAKQIFTAFEENADSINIINEKEEVIETLPLTPEQIEKANHTIDTGEPEPADFGIWIPGIPILLEVSLNALNCAEWLKGLILDGIVAGVGAVLGFVPQMLVLFLFLAFLEACGYMARVAFIMDRIFRKFGLSGKSFIPMLIGSGCSVPGIMASRTIENDRDRKMTIITTTFIPCGAKLPIIALISGALFQGSWWVAPSAYFIGIAAVVCSGILLKKTKWFVGEPTPFVMELPAYHLPTIGNVFRSMWERAWSFIKKAGTIIFLSTIFIWFTTFFGWVDGQFRMLESLEIQHSILAAIGNTICWIFTPLGWGDWKSVAAAITGLIAKENVVGTFGILFGFAEVAESGTEIWGTLAGSMAPIASYSFLVFNLLCAPCFAAIGAIKREMNNTKWTWFAIGYQTIFAYGIALLINQFGNLFSKGFSSCGIGTVLAFFVLIGFLYLLFRPASKGKTQSSSVK